MPLSWRGAGRVSDVLGLACPVRGSMGRESRTQGPREEMHRHPPGVAASGQVTHPAPGRPPRDRRRRPKEVSRARWPTGMGRGGRRRRWGPGGAREQRAEKRRHVPRIYGWPACRAAPPSAARAALIAGRRACECVPGIRSTPGWGEGRQRPLPTLLLGGHPDRHTLGQGIAPRGPGPGREGTVPRQVWPPRGTSPCRRARGHRRQRGPLFAAARTRAPWTPTGGVPQTWRRRRT